MHLFTDLTITTIILIFSFTSLTGIGYLTSLIFKFNRDELVLYYTFLGFAVCLTLLEIINFFSPINFYFSLIFFVFGTSIFLAIKGLHFPSITLKKIKFTYITLGILFFIWTLKSMDVVSNLDSSTYHLSFIKWSNEYPLVGGLGNLIINFANNQSWFLFVSLLSFSPIFENGHAIAGLFILLLSIVLIFKKRYVIPYPNIFLPIFFVSIIFNTYRLSSPSPDLAINIITVIIFFLLLEVLNSTKLKNFRFHIFLIISLCISLITIKLSGAPFACLTLIYIYFNYRKLISYKDQFIIMALIFFLLTPHLIRGFYISGYPLFPFTFGSFFDPDWKLELDSVKFHSDLISCWGKDLYQKGCGNFLNFSWINNWVIKTPFEIILYLLISVILFFFALIKFKKNTNEENIFFLSLLPFLSLIVWFFKAPDPRFAISLIMLFLGSSVCIFVNNYNLKITNMTDNKTIGIVILSSLIATLRFSTISPESMRYILKNGYFSIPTPIYSQTYVSPNLTINIPKGSKCYKIELPCMYVYRKGLNLIDNHLGFPKMYFHYDK